MRRGGGAGRTVKDWLYKNFTEKCKLITQAGENSLSDTDSLFTSDKS